MKDLKNIKNIKSFAQNFDPSIISGYANALVIMLDESASKDMNNIADECGLDLLIPKGDKKMAVFIDTENKGFKKLKNLLGL